MYDWLKLGKCMIITHAHLYSSLSSFFLRITIMLINIITTSTSVGRGIFYATVEWRLTVKVFGSWRKTLFLNLPSNVWEWIRVDISLSFYFFSEDIFIVRKDLNVLHSIYSFAYKSSLSFSETKAMSSPSANLLSEANPRPKSDRRHCRFPLLDDRIRYQTVAGILICWNASKCCR